MTIVVMLTGDPTGWNKGRVKVFPTKESAQDFVDNFGGSLNGEYWIATLVNENGEFEC